MKSQITIHNAVGKWIFFRLTNPPKELIGSTTGIYEPKGWIKAKLCGVDEVGVWLENPHFKITYLFDDEGNPIPPGKQKETTETSLVLIKWQFIASIVCITTGEVNQDKRPIGFLPLGQQPEEPATQKRTKESSRA